MLYAELVLLGKKYTKCRSPLSMGLGILQFYSEDDSTCPILKSLKFTMFWRICWLWIGVSFQILLLMMLRMCC